MCIYIYVDMYMCTYIYIYVYCLNEYTHTHIHIYRHIKVHILTLNVLNRVLKNGGLKPVFAGVDVRSRHRLYIHLGVQE